MRVCGIKWLVRSTDRKQQYWMDKCCTSAEHCFCGLRSNQQLDVVSVEQNSKAGSDGRRCTKTFCPTLRHVDHLLAHTLSGLLRGWNTPASCTLYKTPISHTTILIQHGVTVLENLICKQITAYLFIWRALSGSFYTRCSLSPTSLQFTLYSSTALRYQKHHSASIHTNAH